MYKTISETLRLPLIMLQNRQIYWVLWLNISQTLTEVPVGVHSCSVVPRLCNLLDLSLPGSSVHGVFQARILEWVAIFLLQGIFPTRGIVPTPPVSPALQADSLPAKPSLLKKTLLSLYMRTVMLCKIPFTRKFFLIEGFKPWQLWEIIHKIRLKCNMLKQWVPLYTVISSLRSLVSCICVYITSK